MTRQFGDAQLDQEIRAFLNWHSDDVGGAPSAGEMAARVREHVRPRGLVLFDGSQRRLALALLLSALLALLLAVAAFVGSQRPALTTTVENGWIAFSTQPGYKQVAETDWAAGGDIYLARRGFDPQAIAERGSEMKSNVCPQFSPDGSLLVYGELNGVAAALVVLEVDDAGAVSEWRRLPLPGAAASAPCPRWSRGGTHLAYLDGLRWSLLGQPDTSLLRVELVDLGGAPVPPTDQDPSVQDLTDSGTFDPLDWPDGTGQLLSPDGGLQAICTDEGLVVRPLDGSADRWVDPRCGYSLAAWSPDGNDILSVGDDGRFFGVTVVSLAGSPSADYVAKGIPLNGIRSLPGRGDFTWQPVYP